jgi:hypothetical protein
MRVRKVWSVINSVNQQNLKINNAKSKDQHEIQPRKKRNRNIRISKYFSVTTLNVNELHCLIQRQTVWLDQKARYNNLLSIRNIPLKKNTYKLKWKVGKRYIRHVEIKS